MAINPFSILAIDPHAIKTLNDAQIRELILSSYRVLSKFYHPDAGGSAEKFQEIAEALEQLDQTKGQYEYWKAKLVQSKKDKVQQMQEVLDKQVAASELACNRLLQVWGSISDSRAFGHAAHAMRNARLLMSDTMEMTMKVKAINESRKGLRFFVTPKLTGTAYDLDIDNQGKLHRTVLEKVEYVTAKETPAVHDGWIESRGNKRKSYYWERADTTPLEGYKLLGCLDVDAMQPLKGEGLSFSALLPGPVCDEHFEWIRGGFPVHVFSPAIPFLKPSIRPLDYLVAGTVRGKDLFFVMLGQIRKLVSHKKLREKQLM